MRRYILFLIGLIAVAAAGLFTWRQIAAKTAVLGRWDNTIVAEGFWLHPYNSASQQTLYVQQYEAEIKNSYTDNSSGKRGLELQDLRTTDLILSLEIPAQIIRGAAYESLPAQSLDLVLPLTPAEIMQRLNRKGNRIRMLVAQELHPTPTRFIEALNFLTVQPDVEVDPEQ